MNNSFAYAIPGLKFRPDHRNPDSPMGLSKAILIREKVAHHFRLSIGEITSKSRKPQYVLPRQIAIAMIKEHTSLTHTSTGRLFGYRDHTTVIHSLQAIKNYVDTGDEKVIALIQHFRQIV
jgi:chromosomal replication initiator protein